MPMCSRVICLTLGHKYVPDEDWYEYWPSNPSKPVSRFRFPGNMGCVRCGLETIDAESVAYRRDRSDTTDETR